MEPSHQTGTNPIMVGGGLVILALLGTSAYGLYTLDQEHRRAQALETANQAMTASLRQTHSELDALSAKIDALSAQRATPPAAEAAPSVSDGIPSPVRRSPVVKSRHRTATAKPVEDPRWKQMQTRMDDQEKEIAAARDSVNQARTDLASRLDSTRDDLNGSIAKNHDELVVLQKRGERNYYEFQLNKSKQLTKVGPVSLSLRKVNNKHRYYDLVMMVDDQQLEKKHVSLYEPVMLTLADRPQPLELVVNQIDGNQIKGYVSEPKYKKSELITASAANTNSAPQATPVKTLQTR